MDRFKSVKLSALIALLCILTYGNAFGNTKIFQAAQRVFSTYRMNVPVSEMHLEKMDSGSSIFVIHIDARRNNFDMALMVGFVAAGTAVKQIGSDDISGIRIVVDVPYKETTIIQASSTIQQVMHLVDGETKPEEFMRNDVIFT